MTDEMKQAMERMAAEFKKGDGHLFSKVSEAAFKAGFTAAAEMMEKEIQKLKSALQVAKNVMIESVPSITYSEVRFNLEEAIAEIERIEGETK